MALKSLTSFVGPLFDTQRKFSTGALVTSAVAAVSTVAAWRYFARRRASQVPASHTKKERLLDIESTVLMDYLPGTSTITFYQGDAVTVAKFLSERLARVVELNPWCLGSLTRGDDGHNVLHYPPESSTGLPANMFALVSDPLLRPDLPYNELADRSFCYSVGNGLATIGHPENPLLRLTVIDTTPGCFAVYFSVSHTIADGYTFYKLWSMLSAAEQPYAMSIDRLHSFSKDLNDVLAPNDGESWFNSVATTVNFVFTALFCSRARAVLHAIPNEWVEQQKLAHKATDGVPFVSSNDVVSSLLFRLSGCDVSFMAVNFRRRIAALTNLMAGNYESVLVYQNPDFQTPALIRQSVNSMRRVNGEVSLPNFISSLSRRVCLLSSWATFYSDVQLPGSKSIYHVPIYQTSSQPALFDVYVLFRPTHDQLSLLAFTRYLTPEALSNATQTISSSA